MNRRNKVSFFTKALNSPLFTVAWNLLLVYFFFMVCRVVFVLVNYNLYVEYLTPRMLISLFKGGLVFDTSAILYLSAIYIVMVLFPCHLKERRGYHLVAKGLFVTLNMLGIVMNLVDTVYFKYSGRRTTISVFNEFSNDDNIISIIATEALKSWYLTLIGIIMIVALIKFTRIPSVNNGNRHYWSYYFVSVPVFLAVIPLSIFGMRGGTGSIRPITLSNANQYVDRPVEAMAVLNTPFVFLRTIDKKNFVNPGYFPEDELNDIFNPVIYPDSDAVFRQKNVVVLIVESFGKEYIGALNSDKDNYETYTPFLDSLVEHSLFYSWSFGNGRKSIDGMPSILSGIPMFVEPFFLTPSSMNKVSGIAGELKKIGYYTAFFHGAKNGSMGFQAYSRATGFDEYFGRTEFEQEPGFNDRNMYDGTWAIWDEPFLQFFCYKMNSFREPFMTSVFTASSHHPFLVPDNYKDVFKEGSVPIHKCVRYTDNALRAFFSKASEQQWFANTLFVITADHTNQSVRPEYQTDGGLFSVPILFYDPSGEISGRVNAIAQHIDIMPSVLGYLGYDRPFVSFGQNLFATPLSETYAVNYLNGVYQYFKHDYLLQFDGEGVMALYNFKEDPLLKSNIKGELPVQQEMLRELKAIIQQYMERMNSDRLVVDRN